MAGWFKHAREVKVGVVGYGGAFNMGKQHLLEMRKAGMTPFAVCEVDAERLKVATEDFPGIETYGSLDAMLKQSDVDLLVHITPHNLHYPLAKKCLQAGKHVVTEKPFVLDTKQADDLIRIADRNKRMVSTYHNRHWDGWILRARQQVVDKKILGDVFRIELHMDAFGGYAMPRDWWRTSRSISGGILYDWGVHLLEYALQLVDGEITEVVGFAKEGYWASVAPKNYPWKSDMNEDEAHAIVRMSSGAMIHLSISMLRSEPRPDYFLAAVGTKGAYLINWKQWTTRLADRKHQLVEKTGEHPKARGDLFYKNVAEYLTGQAELIITPEWARRPIHILDLAGQSARQGKALKAKYG